MPKKRTRGGSAVAGRPARRTRVSDDATSPSGRPVRTTTQDNPPKYNFTRRHSSSAAQDSRSPTPATAKKPAAASTTSRRGRPPKTTKSTPPAPKPAPSGRGRGRPPGIKNKMSYEKEIEATAPVDKAKKAKTAKTGIGANAAEEQEEPEDDFEEDGMQYWLMKAEPESRFEKGVDVKFSIDDLKASDVPEPWDGVRNPVARNNMRAMNKGDLAFFYHSNCKHPGIVGIMRVADEHSVDETAFDPNHPYYDEKSSREKPRWDCVKVEFVRKFPEQISLTTLRSFAKAGGKLEKMQTLVQSRLSVSSVQPREWRFIMSLVAEGEEADEQGPEDHGASNNVDEIDVQGATANGDTESGETKLILGGGHAEEVTASAGG